MDIPDVPLRCLNIPLPRCMRRLVEEHPAPFPIGSGDIQVLDLITKFTEKYENIGEDEIKQARNLASGHSDIVIILERPAPNHDYSVDFGQFIIDCPTLNAVDGLIKLATKGKRSIQSVSVFDAHSFKPHSFKPGKGDEFPTDNDCYLLLEEMLKAKKPKVVICCWSGWKERCTNPFIRQILGGGIGCREIRDEVNIDDWDFVAIRSFHPSIALRRKKYDADFRALLVYHFIAAFTELSHRIEQPCWLLEIVNRSKSSWKSQNDDSLATPWDTKGCKDAHSRAINILYDIVEEDQVNCPGPFADTNQGQQQEIAELLRCLRSSKYQNGSTYISRLFLLWDPHFSLNPEYDEVRELLVEIGSNQEWFDPKDDSIVYATAELLKRIEEIENGSS